MKKFDTVLGVIDFETKVLNLAKISENPTDLLGLLRIGVVTENISDACAQIAEIVIRKLELHPLLNFILSDADETIVKVKVDEDFYYIPITIFAQYAIKE